MREVTTVVKIDAQGRIRVPTATREALGIKDRSALLEISIRLLEEKV